MSRAAPIPGDAPDLDALRSENEALRADRRQLLAALTAISRTLGGRTHAPLSTIAASRPTARGRRGATATARPRPPDQALADPGLRDLEEVGRLRIDRRSLSADVDGHEVPLTPREFDLLSYLRDHRGQPLTREHLLRAVWSTPFSEDPRTLRVHINAIRTKLERFVPPPIQITTLQRVGYRLDRLDDAPGSE